MTSARTIRVLFALGVLSGAAGRADADMCVTVNAHFSQRAPSDLLEKVMANEASSIWEQYGVRIMWSDHADDRHRFTGPDRRSAMCDCAEGSFDLFVERRTSPLAMKQKGVVLGSTYLQLLSIDHAPIRIDYDATERMLESLPNDRLIAVAGHPGLGSADLGRALGRVLAHEIGHVLLAAPNHQEQGLMRSSYVPADLVGVQRTAFTLSKGEIVRLHQRERVLAATRAEALP